MDWRVICKDGKCITFSTRLNAEGFAFTQSQTFLMDRMNKTIVVIEDKFRLLALDRILKLNRIINLEPGSRIIKDE